MGSCTKVYDFQYLFDDNILRNQLVGSRNKTLSVPDGHRTLL